MSKVSDIVADKVIEMLDSGVAPWHQPWTSQRSMPRNTWGKPYRGINVFLLGWEKLQKGYKSNFWLTYKQVQERGGQVRPGSKGTMVVFWKVGKPYQEFDEEKQKQVTRRPFMLRYFTVFNLDQTANVKMTKAMQAEQDFIDGKVADLFEPYDDAEAIIGTYFARDDAPTLLEGSEDGCWFRPFDDTVGMPWREDFEGRDEYYASLFHEMVHSTGARKRLNRKGDGGINHFGDEKYGREELVAELGAAMVCAEAGIDSQIQQHAAYVQNWKDAIKADKGIVMWAAGKAQKARDYIMGEEFEGEAEEPEKVATA